MPYLAWQMINRIDAHQPDESSQKKESDLYP